MGYIKEFGKMISWLGPPEVKPNPQKIYSNSYIHSNKTEESMLKALMDIIIALLCLFCGYAFLILILFGLYHLVKFLF